MQYLRVLLLLFLTPLVLSSPEDLLERVVKFEVHHDRFVRGVFGCPMKGDMTHEVCHPKRGIVSYEDFLKARKAAAELYSLKYE